MLHTTFRNAKEEGACKESYTKMAKSLGGVRKYGLDAPIPLDKVLEVCGLGNTLWALRIVLEPVGKEIRLFACDCAQRVLPLFEAKYPDDKRPRQAIEIARRFANGQATQKEMAAARDAARDAEAAAGDAARTAAWDATRDAETADWDAARDAARTAVWAADWAAARAAAEAAAEAAWAAAWAATRDAETAAWAAARAVEQDWQKEHLIQMLNGN